MSVIRWLIRYHIDTQDIPYHREMITREVRHAVVRRDGRICRYCGVDCRSYYELDHVYPSSLGGQTTPENLVVACKRCNRNKSVHVGIWPLPVGWYGNRGRFSRWLMRVLLG